jgi:hypothetical protein
VEPLFERSVKGLDDEFVALGRRGAKANILLVNLAPAINDNYGWYRIKPESAKGRSLWVAQHRVMNYSSPDANSKVTHSSSFPFVYSSIND